MDERAVIADLERRLAAAEARLLEKGEIEASLRQSEELRRIAVEGGGMGTWRWNLRDARIWGDAAFMALWGFPASDEARRLPDFTARMSEHGQAEMGEMVSRAMAAGEAFDGQLAITTGPTAGRWVRWRGRAERERPWIVNGVSFDVTEQRLQEQRLRESEARHRLLIESWAQAMWETDADGAVVADSPSWRACTGQTPEAWLGFGWLAAIHPDDRAGAERQWREAVAARVSVNTEVRLQTADGGWRWTNVRATPLRDAGGVIRKWVGLNIDIDARKRAEAALRGSEERNAFLVRFSDAVRGLADPTLVARETARLLSEQLGTGLTLWAVMDWKARAYVADWAFLSDGTAAAPTRWPFDARDPFAAAHLAGRSVVYDDVARDPRIPQPVRAAMTERGLLAGIAVPVLVGGSLVAVLNTSQAATRRWTAEEVDFIEALAQRAWGEIERARAEAALRESEDLRRIALESGGMGAWRWDTRTGQVLADEPFQKLWGVTFGGQLHPVSVYMERMAPDGAAKLEAVMRLGTSSTEELHDQVRVSLGPTAGRWIQWRGRADPDKPWIINGVSFDITEAKAAAKRQEVLVNELQHRARNLLGVVTAVASRTVKQGGSVEAFEERLLALSRVQGLLSSGGSDTVEVGALLRAELAVHEEALAGRITIAGPKVHLRARQVQNYALAVHELTTNAVKYGALKIETGRLAVSWEVVSDRHRRPWLALRWVESGVTLEPGKVTRRGYGTELIQEALAYALDARVDYELGADGVRCRIEMPIP